MMAALYVAVGAILAVTRTVSGSTPATMNAFVQVGADKQAFVSSFLTPKLGSLHSMYAGLPNSCEVLVRVEWSSVNPSDRHPEVSSSLYPHVLGSDISGVVVETQSTCKTVQVGDRVYGDIGANTVTKGGDKTKELGGYGQYVVALESQLGIVPAAMSLEVAGSLPKVALTSYKALVWYAYAKNDTLWKRSPTVMVLGGSGGCGSTGIQLAKYYGAGSLITTTSTENFDYCKGLGATRLIDYKTQNWWDVVPDDSVDVIYDTVGQFLTGDRAMQKLRTGGHYVSITGALAGKVKSGVTQHDFINSDTNLNNTAIWIDLNDAALSGHLTMPATMAFNLSDVSNAFAMSATGQVKGKLTINVN